jgi:DNA-binding GntR family transcriptional regulator
MITLGPEVLAGVGLTGMTEAQVRLALQDIYSTLELRVGRRIAKKMTQVQLSQFEKHIAANDERAALSWLNDNFPDYREVVQEEYQLILERLNSAAKAGARD